MATNFSPCKGSYVLNQFPSNVMFGMNGFHVSASGAIQGHHGPLVLIRTGLNFSHAIKGQTIDMMCLPQDPNFLRPAYQRLLLFLQYFLSYKLQKSSF